MNRMLAYAAAVAVCVWVVFTSPARGAEWQPPKDGVMTDKQVTAYIETFKEVLQNYKAAGKAIEGTNNALVAGRVLQGLDDKSGAAMARHGLAEPEFKWLAERVLEARGQLYLLEQLDKADADVAERLKKSAAEQAAIKQKQATYEAATKAGRRVMTAEERAEATKSAKSDQQTAEEEAKGHQDAAKEAADAAARAEAEAKAAESAMKSPPKELTGDDRQAFIEEQKNTAEGARANAKVAREKEAEERKLQAESKAKAAAAAARAKDPDLPATDDERAEVKKQNEEMLASLRSDLQTAGEADKQLKDAAEQVRKQAAETKGTPAAKNAAVLKPHAKLYDDAWQTLK